MTTSGKQGLQHIAERWLGEWKPLCQVFGPMFGIRPHGFSGRGKCRACQEVWLVI